MRRLPLRLIDHVLLARTVKNQQELEAENVTQDRGFSYPQYSIETGTRVIRFQGCVFSRLWN